MLKRILPLLLLLSVACQAGCTRQDDPNKNGNARPNVNANSNNGSKQPYNGAESNANTTESIGTVRTREDRTVTITVYDDAGTIKILVSPDPIKLIKPKNQRLRFHVVNNTDVDIREVVINFKTENPMDGGFSVTDIPAGDDKSTTPRRIKGTAAPNSYKYGIKVFGSGTDPIAELDPEVAIAV